MRIVEVSILRMIMMLLVIVFHSCVLFYRGYPIDNQFVHVDFYARLCRTLHSINMPMFITLSGISYGYVKYKVKKYSSWRAFFEKKIRRLFVPFCIWVIITSLVIYKKVQFHEIFHMWFLLMLMWCFVFIVFLHQLLQKCSLSKNLLAFSAIFIGYFLLDYFNCRPSFFCLNEALMYFPFFYLGVIWERFSVRKLLHSMNRNYFLGLTLILMILVYAFTFSDPFVIYGHLARLFGAFLTLSVLHYLPRRIIPKEEIPKWIRVFDENGMGIYILHQIIIIRILVEPKFASFVNEHIVVGPILLFAFSLFSSLTISWLINKTKLRFIFG